MRLLLISVYPPFPAPEANHALHLSERLAEAGVEVHVLCQKGSAAAPNSNIILHPVMENWSFAEILRIKRAIELSKPDAILLLYLGWIYRQSVMMTVLPSITGFLKRGVPFITQFEAIEGANIEQSPLRALARRTFSYATNGKFHRQFGTLLERSDAIVTLSEPHKQALVIENPSVAEKSVVMPPPPLIRVSTGNTKNTRTRIRRKYKVRGEEFLFVFWGHIYPGKGLEILLMAFERVRREEPTARLLIVGGALSVSKSSAKSSAYYRMVRELPEKFGIGDGVGWTGPFDWDSEKGSEYLYASDACILPFDWGVTLNNSSLAAAATHGLPIIATKNAGTPDPALAHGQNVYLCPPRDAAALADAMTQLIRAPAFRETLRKGSRSLADKWHSWPAVAARMKLLLETAKPQDLNGSRNAWQKALAGPHSSAPGGAGLKPVKSKSKVPNAKLPAVPLVSVIVAVHNVEKYLPQCLDSLVHQTLRGIEIIAIDDASTDESRKILDQYGARYASLRVVPLEKNLGLASVRNIGLEQAKGDYVVFLDGDDWADIRMCETLYEGAREVDADLVSASATVYNDEQKTFAPLFDQLNRNKISEFAKKYWFNITEEPRALLLEVVAWAKIYNKKFLLDNKINFEGGLSSYEDSIFHVKCMIKAKRIRVIDDPVMFYRQNRPGQISAMTGKNKYQVFKVFNTIHNFVIDDAVSNVVWGQVIRIELRHYAWMLESRTAPSERRKFITCVADCLSGIPRDAWRGVKYLGIRDAAQSIAMRRGWLSAYMLAKSRSTIPARLLCLSSLRVLSEGGLLQGLQGDLDPGARSSLPKLPRDKHSAHGMNTSLNSEVRAPAPSSIIKWHGGSVELHRVRNQEILVADTRNQINLSDAIWRTEHVHFMSQPCMFRPNDIIVDIGAHVGIATIHLAKMFPFVKIYAVEPDKRKFRYLEKNIELNKVKNIQAMNIAISGFNGKSTLFSGPRDEEWTTINSKFAFEKKSFTMQEVGVTTIKNLFQKLKIRECRMLKISAWGSVKDILNSIPTTVNIDYLCGEVDVEDCNVAALEVASWRHSRHHFWRTWRTMGKAKIWSNVHQLPTTCAKDWTAHGRLSSMF